LLVLALILAGCGGGGGDGGNSKWQQVQGDGVSFQAPAGWKVAGNAASKGRIDRVQVTPFKLRRAYAHAQLAAAVKELDDVADGLAKQQKGKVTRRRTLQVAGFDARAYAIDYQGLTEEITFVLRDKREYELLCRRAKGADDSACRRLVSSFRVTAAASAA
jgi:hypothetical protein